MAPSQINMSSVFTSNIMNDDEIIGAMTAQSV